MPTASKLAFTGNLAYVLFLTLFFCTSIQAEMVVRATVEPSQIRIGDRFAYRITVEHDTGWQAQLPGLVGNLGSFEVKEMQVQDASEKKSRGSRTWEATLSTIISGDFMLPQQSVELVRGEDTVRTSTEALQIRVLSATTGEETDIDGVEAPFPDPRWAVWVWWALGLAGLLLLGLLWWWWRRSRSKVPVPELPPYEQALAALANLGNTINYEPENQGRFFFELSFIARRYLQRRFLVEVLDATTTELVQRVPSIPELTNHQQQNFLLFAKRADLVKFARLSVPPEECKEWHALVSNLVEQTRPLPQEQEKRVSPSNAEAKSESEPTTQEKS